MQNVNLFQQEQRRHGGPKPRQMALGLALLLIGVVLHGGWSAWQWHAAGQAAERAQQLAEAEQARLAQFKANYREPVLDPQLPKQLAEREAQNGQLLQLAEYLGKLDAERAEGFVPILTALADRHPPAGLWLTTIQLRAGGHDMSLKGQSRDQELLPLYLQSLGVSPAFAGREFARFDVQRDERQLLEFTLSSHAGADDGE